MHIHIEGDFLSEKDLVVIKLLEVSLPFENAVKKIRKKFQINKGASGLYSEDLSKYKPVVRNAFIEIRESYENKLKNQKLQKEIEQLCKDFNLDDRWYQAIAEIVIFSSVTNLNNGIYCWVSKNENKSSLIGNTSILIEVMENVSKERLIQWVKNNWEKYRQEAQSNSVLKKQKGIPQIDFIEFDQEIIKMHERQKLNPHQISSIMEERYKDSESSWKRNINEKLIEQRLKRYKKLFNLN